MGTPRVLTILLYHGVTQSTGQGIQNYSGKHIHVDLFAEQMRHLKRRCSVLSIDEVVRLTQAGEPFPERAAVVSFDDGFENNYTVAAPILDDIGVPAVFYISSGIVNTNMMFWVDEIEDCVNLSSNPSVTLTLDKPTSFPISSREDRIATIETIKQFCKRSTSGEKNRVIAALIEACGVIPSIEHAFDYRKITWKQVRAMAANPLFTIGGHSLYHDILSELPLKKMQEDIRISLDLLTYNLSRSVTHYSYPEGQASHFNNEVIACLKSHGIICCPSAINGTNRDGTDLFHLKRSMVGFMGISFPVELS
jgi:peptidoglycan/xylan/chitin deacetylase (PgdA/CDA1 family)